MTHEEKIELLLTELSAASGYMMNAIIDLDMSTKLTAMKTLAEGRKRIEAVLAEVGAT
jgi:hypothetical protein